MFVLRICKIDIILIWLLQRLLKSLVVNQCVLFLSRDEIETAHVISASLADVQRQGHVSIIDPVLHSLSMQSTISGSIQPSVQEQSKFSSPSEDFPTLDGHTATSDVGQAMVATVAPVTVKSVAEKHDSQLPAFSTESMAKRLALSSNFSVQEGSMDDFPTLTTNSSGTSPRLLAKMSSRQQVWTGKDPKASGGRKAPAATASSNSAWVKPDDFPSLGKPEKNPTASVATARVLTTSTVSSKSTSTSLQVRPSSAMATTTPTTTSLALVGSLSDISRQLSGQVPSSATTMSTWGPKTETKEVKSVKEKSNLLRMECKNKGAGKKTKDGQHVSPTSSSNKENLEKAGSVMTVVSNDVKKADANSSKSKDKAPTNLGKKKSNAKSSSPVQDVNNSATSQTESSQELPRSKKSKKESSIEGTKGIADAAPQLDKSADNLKNKSKKKNKESNGSSPDNSIDGAAKSASTAVSAVQTTEVVGDWELSSCEFRNAKDKMAPAGKSAVASKDAQLALVEDSKPEHLDRKLGSDDDRVLNKKEASSVDNSSFPAFGMASTFTGLTKLDFPSLTPAVVKPIAAPPGFERPVSKPPPGFGLVSAVKKPPPGFFQPIPNGNLILAIASEKEVEIPGTVASVGSSSEYILPKEGQQRNRLLIESVLCAVDNDADKFQEFKLLSSSFRSSDISGKEYYRRCQSVLGAASFTGIFPELLVLLPNIAKQQELLAAHREVATAVRKTCRGTTWHISDDKLSSCLVCGQVLLLKDLPEHNKRHNLDNDFPELGPSSSATKLFG